MKDTVILVTHEGMGYSKDLYNLPITLLGKYLDLLNAGDNLPNAICFYTDGVKMVIDGSSVLTQLKALEAKGVRLIICSTCLDAFGLTEQVQVGIIGGMPDIIEAQIKASKVITL
ncbi:MAG: DsrE family protein [Chloroflexi bacterium]|nr:DsrE family protein [Chloroflexota bacterium]